MNVVVFVVYDGFNEEVMGVFSTVTDALRYQRAYPSPWQLDIERFTLNDPKLVER